MIKDNQINLFEAPPTKQWWEDHWQGMPEFDQKIQRPYLSLYVHFEKKEDMENFSKKIGQKVKRTSKSIWFPELKLEPILYKRYKSEL